MIIHFFYSNLQYLNTAYEILETITFKSETLFLTIDKKFFFITEL